MATLDLAGIITRVCTDLKEKFASKSVETSKQDKLVSGTNIKTVNGNSLLGTGNISISTANSVGYELRTNYISMTASDSCGPHRIWLTSADGTKMVPINTDTSSSWMAKKTLNTRPINPFGQIIYYPSSMSANSTFVTYDQWYQYNFRISYSYVKTLTAGLPVYLKCTPQNDGSAIMADIVQELPTSDDGFIYIFLGAAYGGSDFIELLPMHPVYWHDGIGVRLWSGARTVNENNFSDILEKTSKMDIIGVDETTRDVFRNLAGINIAIPQPSSLQNLPIIKFMIDNRYYLAWMNGAEVELSPITINIDTGSSEIVLYAYGKHSMASGIAGVDESWTITALPTDADGVSY